MYLNKKTHPFLCSIALMLCLSLLFMTTMGMTVAAAGDDTPPADTVSDTTEEATETEPDTETAGNAITYTIDEAGNLVISIGSEEWVYDGADTAIGTVVTNGSRLNLRTGAGTYYTIIEQLLPGEEVTVLGTVGDWYQVILPEKTGYVHSDYLELSESAGESSAWDSETLALIMSQMLQNLNAETPSTLTPDGNLTLIDDIVQTEVPADEDTELQEKQFITVQSKNGNYFYLVIDRTGDTENVYFLNLVDEADLLALMEDGETVAVCSCPDKCETGAVNTDCEVCQSNMTECAGTEPVTEQESDAETEVEAVEEKSGNIGLILVALLLLAGGGAALWWFKFRKEKPKAKGSVDLDDYDYGDEDDEDIDDEDYETELEDGEEPGDETDAL